MLFSKDDGGHQYSGSASPDLGLMVRMGNVELSDYSHQEGLHLEDTIQKVVLSLPRERE